LAICPANGRKIAKIPMTINHLLPIHPVLLWSGIITDDALGIDCFNADIVTDDPLQISMP